MEHVPVLHSSAVDFMEQLHENERGEHHGGVLTRSARYGGGRREAVSYVEQFRTEEDQDEENRELVSHVARDVPQHASRHERLVPSVRLVRQKSRRRSVACQCDGGQRVHEHVHPQQLRDRQRAGLQGNTGNQGVTSPQVT